MGEDEIGQELPSDLIFQDPKSYKEAINSECKDYWLVLMKTELDTHSINNTWDLVPLPNGVKPSKTRWACKIKDPENSTTTIPWAGTNYLNASRGSKLGSCATTTLAFDQCKMVLFQY